MIDFEDFLYSLGLKFIKQKYRYLFDSNDYNYILGVSIVQFLKKFLCEDKYTVEQQFLTVVKNNCQLVNLENNKSILREHEYKEYYEKQNSNYEHIGQIIIDSDISDKQKELLGLYLYYQNQLDIQKIYPYDKNYISQLIKKACKKIKKELKL